MQVDFRKAYPTLTSFLLRQVAHDLTAHSYLFLGRRGVGKASIAEGFANALVDGSEVDKEQGAYFQIDLLRDWTNGLHPDIVFLRPVDGETHIGIDAARSFQRTMSEKPFLSPRRVGVIVHAELLTPEAMASILKLLEEPPKNAVLLLLGETEAAFPKTILSRCQVLWVPRLADELLHSVLYLTDAEDDQLSLELAHGRVRFAAALHASPELRESQQERLNEAIMLLEQHTAARGMRMRMSEAQEVRNFFDMLELLLSDLTTGHLYGTGTIRSTAVKTAFLSVGRRMPLPHITRLAKYIFKGRELLDAHVSPQGIFEQLVAII